MMLVLPVAVPAAGRAQQPAAAARPLVLDGVTVVDVAQGTLVAAQRVVITGNRIQALGEARAVPTPTGAQVVNAKGKYLIPGLWDLHVHPRRSTHLFYPLFIANGVTGIRDGGSEVPLDTLLLWRREILAGTRVGPPRQLLSGQSIAGPQPGCERRRTNTSPQTCITDSADARHYVDSIAKAGADWIKPRAVSKAMYFVIAAEARRLGLPFGGHGEDGAPVTAMESADSGARLIDHELGVMACWRPGGSVEQCQEGAKYFQRLGTWFMPTLARTPVLRGPGGHAVSKRLAEHARAFWNDSTVGSNWLRDSTRSSVDSSGPMAVAQRVGLLILAGTDAGAPVLRTIPPGFSLHAELAMVVADGMTPLEALRAATLNPATMLRRTDSLGTVAAGKLADLVLLDANPLADITNTTAIHAVVANGRYFDRAALDRLLTEVRDSAKNP